MKKITATFVFALVSMLATPGMAAEPQPAEKKVLDLEAGAAGVEKAKAPVKKPVRGGPKDQRAIWWDDTGIQKALSLTEEQRTKMTGYLKAHRAKVPPVWKLDVFHESLVQRDWKAAEEESKRISKAAELALRMRGQLKIDVLSVLTKEQHALLVDRFPRLIYKPWARATRATPNR